MLEAIGAVVLDERAPPALARAALDDYGRVCAEVTGITPDAGFGAWEADAFLAGGVAINPRAAANCLLDHLRTLTFLRAVNAALARLLAAPGRGPVDLLYAGCGPWATLLLPILPRLPVGRLRITLLDVHPSAVRAVAQLIEHFGLGDHDLQALAADACSHRCAHPPALIVTETMHKALEQEPQFAVTAALAPQLAANGIFLPERIDVDLQLTGPQGRMHLGRVMSLSQAAYAVPAPAEFRVPAGLDAAATRAVLSTSIRVFEHYRLAPGDAHITGERPCPEFEPITAGARLRVAFRTGTCPMFELVRLDPP